MVALITVSNSSGVVAQCDAKCYDGYDPECVCICGGRNHGVGLERAIENNVEQYLGPAALRAYAKQHGYSVGTLELKLERMELAPRQRRRWLTAAADVRCVRAALGLSQAEFAARLGLSRRTVIRAELRGFELPWRSSRGDAVREAWSALQTAAAGEPERPRSPSPGSPAKCHVPATSARSPAAKRDTLRAIASSRKSGTGGGRRQRDGEPPFPRRTKHRPQRPATAANRFQRKRLRLSRELIKARGGKRGRS